MDNKKPTQSSRFLDPKASGTTQTAMPRRVHKISDAQRKPSGFSAAGQAPRHKAAPKAEVPAPEKRPAKPKKEKRSREYIDGEKKPRTGLKLLLGLLAALLLALVLIMVFGDKGTYHMMPTIEWEAAGSFAPDQTPMPGVEGL